jgi:hypothetical protein
MPTADSRSTRGTGEPAEVHPIRPTLGARVRRELVQHRMAYIVLVLFMIGGILIIPEIFPEATRTQGALGGIFLGIWAALSAVPQKFIDE